MATQNKVSTWIGWGLTALVALALVFSASMKLMNTPEFTKEFVDRLGYPQDVAFGIAIVELGCVVIYLIPQTAILGAVLLTAYLGGAVTTHVRVHDNFVPPIVVGVLVWLSILLRDPRVRVLLPIRRPMA